MLIMAEINWTVSKPLLLVSPFIRPFLKEPYAAAESYADYAGIINT